MLKVILALLALLLAVLRVNAPPPFNELDKVSEVPQAEDLISTELTLRPPSTSYPEPRAFRHSDTSPFQQTPQQRPPVSLFDISALRSSSSVAGPDELQLVGSSEGALFRHTPSRPPQGSEGASSSRAPPQGDEQGPILYEPPPLGTIPFTPDLDRSLGAALGDPAHPGWLRIPWSITAVDSPWLNAYYAMVRRELASAKWTLPDKIELSRYQVDAILHHDVKVMRPGDDIYKVKIQPRFLDVLEPGEVLIQPRRMLTPLRGAQRLESLIVAWSSTNHGRRLAFLGAFHAPEIFRKKLLALEGMERYKVFREPGQLNYYLELAPDPRGSLMEQGSQPNVAVLDSSEENPKAQRSEDEP